jgi:3-keto-L-gulonate-6-phosphate decarboxylase
MGGSYVEEIPVKESAVAPAAIKILKAGQIEIAHMIEEGAMCATVKAIAQNERRSEHVRRRENEKGWMKRPDV